MAVFRFTRSVLLSCAFIAIALSSFTSTARAQSVMGAIQGTVVDQSGGVLPGASVTVTNTDTGIARTTVTDENGVFRAELLPVGNYEVAAELSGFTPQKQQNIAVTVGSTITFRIQMPVASVAETVTVTSTAPIIETTRTQVSDTVSEVQVKNLPVNGRNFINFA